MMMETSALNWTEIISKYSKTLMQIDHVAHIAVVIGGGGLAALVVWRIIMKSRTRPRQRHPLLKRSTSLAVLHGGGMALQRLLDYHEARADPTKLDMAECELKILLSHDQRPDFRELTKVVAKLEMSGKEDYAIQKLEEEMTKAHQNRQWPEAYELEMLLVEMYIFKGEYKKAMDLKCLNEESISDARRPLYKAIITLAQDGPGKEKEAEKLWEKFCELRASFSCEPMVKESMEETGIYKSWGGFEEFKKLVDRLKEDIKKAQDIRKITSSKKY